VLALFLAAAVSTGRIAPSTDTVVLRGRPQVVHVYGDRGGAPGHRLEW
jgi:hypothetical protein